jgi:diacylglycerol kinase family enzyme
VKHLFIINPNAYYIRDRVGEVMNEIADFFSAYPQLSYDVHVTRWKRDAVGYVRKYCMASGEFVRVYAVGGSSTLFEVINGVIGLPNVQTAIYPLGFNNSFPRFFGDRNFQLFQSLGDLVFAETIPIDVIRCGYNYGIAFGMVGVESLSCRDGIAVMERIGLKSNLFFFAAAVYNALQRGVLQNYRVSLDGKTLDGEYISILIANQPHYSAGMYPGADADPSDGIFDVYLVKDVPKPQMAKFLLSYTRGGYRKWPRYVSHHSGTSLRISSGRIMCVCIDGEIFYDTEVGFEMMPYAVDFACPGAIAADRLHTDGGAA